MKYKLIVATFLIILVAVKCSAEINVERMADAIYRAEGGDKARVPYGVLSVKVKDKAEARRVCINSIRNNIKRWEKAGKPGDFVEFFAKRWAPIGSENDPNGLNQNWVKNVKFYLTKIK